MSDHMENRRDQEPQDILESPETVEESTDAAVAESEQKIADMAFDHALEAAITGAKGRNAKAIRALLDVNTLKASKNQAEDIKAALDALKKDNGYLFDDGNTPPPYAGGAGKGPGMNTDTSKMTYSELCAYMEANPGAKI